VGCNSGHPDNVLAVAVVGGRLFVPYEGCYTSVVKAGGG